MKLIQLQSELELNKKTYQVKDLVQAFTKVSAQDVVGFFSTLKLNVPRTVRMQVLRELLQEKVANTQKERDTLADELNYRLRWFNEFSDTQYVNLLEYYQDSTLNSAFLESLWVSILTYLLEKGVSESHVLELFGLSNKKQNNDTLDIALYNQTISVIFYDEEGHLDGLTPNKIRPVLFKSSTLVELREIGRKFGVDVPRRLKKTELLNAIFDELKERNQFDQAAADELSKKSVIMIQRFATDHQIKVSVELKKEEIIEYILEHAHQTKAFYFKPETNAYDYEVEVESEVSQPEPKVELENTQHNPLEESKTTEVVVEKPTKPSKKEKKQVVDFENVIAQEIDEVLTTTQDVVSDEVIDEESDIQTLESLIKPAQIFINAGQYQGKVVDFEDDYHELDGAKEFLTEKQRKQKVPGEIRFLFSLIKVIVLLALRVVELVLIVSVVALVAVFVYASVIHFSEPEALATINELINSYEVFGKGILQHISDFYRSFGL